ncbi:hypothetical protein ACWIGW_16550 [Nocardia brasiliensis]
MSDHLAPLREQLGAEPPESLNTLPAQVISGLAAAIAAARDRQSGEIDVAIARGLKLVPFPLRPIVRKGLFG